MTQHELIDRVVRAAERWSDADSAERVAAVEATCELSNTFTPEAIGFAIDQAMSELTIGKLTAWLNGRVAPSPATVCVLAAGNVPMVELQDWLAVVLSGSRYVGVLSSKSDALLPAFVASAEMSETSTFASLADGLACADALIATGEDETVASVEAMALEAGIERERMLFRGSSSSIAVLTGLETESDLIGLSEDCLLHEGRGCRSVPMVWVPRGYPPDAFLDAAAMFRSVFPAHEATPAALRMPKAMLEALGVPCAYGDDLSFLVSKGAPELPAEPCHIRWVEYDDESDAWRWVDEHRRRIQLVATLANAEATTGSPLPVDIVPFGMTQRPPIDWQPDRVDTVKFACKL